MTATSAQIFLGERLTVSIDRPLGSLHPRYGHVYPVNYGFVEGTLSPDGEELDAYVLDVDVPCKVFQGTCIAFIHRTNDDDDKLIVVPDGVFLTDAQIRRAIDFQEKFFLSRVVRKEV